MNRVRGINIVWLSLIAVLLGSMTINVGVSAAKTKLYLDPATIPGPGQDGSVGESYVIGVYVDQVTDLWGVGFKIQYAPYVSVLTISEIYEGPFLATGWDPFPNPPTDFSYSVDLFQGFVYVAIVRLPNPDPETPRMGASGSGLLATFKLTVIEAGECPIELTESYLLDSNGFPISHRAISGYYEGPSASLTRTLMLPGKSVHVGETMTFNAKVKNDGLIPLNIKVRYDISRLDDGRKIVLRSGQTYYGGGLGEPLPFEYVYVDEFVDELYYEWDGAPENLYGEPDGEYIWSDTPDAWASLFSFEDIALGGMPIADIFLEGYTQYPGGATEAMDIDTYDVSPNQGYPFAWWGSLYGSSSWGWVSPRWTSDSVLTTSPWLADKATLNDVWIMLYKYAGGSAIMRVDSLRLRIEYSTIVPVDAPYFTVMPGDQLDIDPVTWTAELDHVGSYVVSVSIEYTSEGLKWNSWGSAAKTYKFTILP
jgi:hypothetical protein